MPHKTAIVIASGKTPFEIAEALRNAAREVEGKDVWETGGITSGGWAPFELNVYDFEPSPFLDLLAAMVKINVHLSYQRLDMTNGKSIFGAVEHDSDKVASE